MHPLAELWTWFADTSCAGYSPLYDRISRAVAASPEMIELISEAPPRGHQPTVLLAAVHYLLLEGIGHPLESVYAGRSDADPGLRLVGCGPDGRLDQFPAERTGQWLSRLASRLPISS